MNSLGLLETKTIAGGIGLLDLMVKAAEVQILRAGTICSGRFMLQLQGAEAAVAAALAAVDESSVKPVIMYHLTGVNPLVFDALRGEKKFAFGPAAGVIETRRAISGIAAADTAVKQADVGIVRLSLAQGINGKAWLLLSGDVAAVKEAIDSATDAVKKDLLDSLVLPFPDKKLLSVLVPKRLMVP